jgi:hypothetical protein
LDDLEIPKALLGYLYKNNFGNDDPSLDAIDMWVDSRNMDRGLFWKQYELMIKLKLVRLVQDEGTVRLTPKGTLHAEKMGLATPESVARNREIRKRLMSAMANCLTRYGTHVNVTDIVRTAELREDQYAGNLQLLVDMGYARWRIAAQQLTINPKVFAKAGTLSKVA